MNTFGEYVFRTRSYECGSDGRATLPTICNYLQEAASLDAEKLGFSKSNFAAAGETVSWVLTKLRVKMFRYPEWEEEVRVITFPRGGRKIVAWRDFVVADARGETLGVAATEWMVIDLLTRKIVPVPQKVFDLANTERPAVLGEDPFSRFRFPPADDATAPLAFVAQNAHIDLNGHVNNVHYVEWLLEPCPGTHPAEMEVVFRSETLAGDRVLVSVADGGSGALFHRVYSPYGKDHVLAVTRNEPGL